MTTNQLREVHQARPFRPFTIKLADGSRVTIRHPELMMFSPSGRTIVAAVSDDAFKILDLLLVSAIHVGNGHPSKRTKR